MTTTITHKPKSVAWDHTPLRRFLAGEDET